MKGVYDMYIIVNKQKHPLSWRGSEMIFQPYGFPIIFYDKMKADKIAEEYNGTVEKL
jgi:hypothetical protein